MEGASQRETEETLNAAQVREALGRVHEVYGTLRPFEQRELMGLLLKKAEVNEREIILEVYALAPDAIALASSVNLNRGVRTRMKWLPE